jgi:hypothetical protein
MKMYIEDIFGLKYQCRRQWSFDSVMQVLIELRKMQNRKGFCNEDKIRNQLLS